MDKWFKILNEDRRDQRRRQEPTPFKSKAQKRYKALRNKNDIYSSPSGHKNLDSGSPYNNQTQRAGTDNLRFEEVEADSFKIHDELERRIWDGMQMKEEVRIPMLKIAKNFIEGLPFPIDIEDITLTGSLANYNWSTYSDVDLHIIVDFSKIDENYELVKAFFDNVRARWNDKHNITLKGYDVEIYVEDAGESHKSSGVYSVMNDDWIIKPNKYDDSIDFNTARRKADEIESRVNRTNNLVLAGEYKKALRAIDKLKRKVRNMRRAGLESPKQEFSIENIAFKILRRNGILDELENLKTDAYDFMVGIQEVNNEIY